jgi:RNA polymerase-binding transcription factor DksA
MTQMANIALMEAKTTSMPNHMAELGSGNFDRELTLSLLGSERNALDEIEAALERIEDGTYGRCETCGVKLPEPRLEAIPYAALCVQCASEQEHPPITFDFRRRHAH